MSARRPGAPTTSSGTRRTCSKSIRMTPSSAASATATGCSSRAAPARPTLRAQITDRVAPGVVYTTFHHPITQANVVTTDYSDWATNCPEYKVTAVQVSPSNGPTEWQEEYDELAASEPPHRRYRRSCGMTRMRDADGHGRIAPSGAITPQTAVTRSSPKKPRSRSPITATLCGDDGDAGRSRGFRLWFRLDRRLSSDRLRHRNLEIVEHDIAGIELRMWLAEIAAAALASGGGCRRPDRLWTLRHRKPGRSHARAAARVRDCAHSPPPTSARARGSPAAPGAQQSNPCGHAAASGETARGLSRCAKT